MIFYTKDRALFLASALSDISETPFMKNLENEVFWLDVSDYDRTTIEDVGKVLFLESFSIQFKIYIFKNHFKGFWNSSFNSGRYLIRRRK